MIKASLFAAGLCSVLASTVSAGMIAQWDFQTTTTGGTAIAAAPATQKLFVANFGTGSLYLNGTNGSSDFFEPATGTTSTEINAFGGTALNATGSMSTVTTSPAALAIVGGAASVPAGTFGANGKAMVFKFSMSGLSNLSVPTRYNELPQVSQLNNGITALMEQPGVRRQQSLESKPALLQAQPQPMLSQALELLLV
ncbi:MAG: hypothetical protein EBQ58_14270 [Betaproteobacteria bacterium]|nr:hypothetical protein [Betaproteobacteria bacterium]